MSRLEATPLHPPHAIEAEQSVLGGLLLNNRIWFDIVDRLREDDFYTMDHRLIFRGISHMLNKGEPCDFITLSEHFRHQGMLDEVGGIPYLGTLAADTPSAANIKAYAEIVYERSVLRGLIAAGQDLAESGYHPNGAQIEEIVNGAEQRLQELRLRGARGAQHGEMAGVLMERMTALIEQRSRKEVPPALPTHLPELNKMLNGGLADGDLIIVGGRPGMGKTSFAMNIAEFVAINLGKPVAVFSMEMPAQQCIERTIAARASIPLDHILTGDLTDDDWDSMTRVDHDIRSAPLMIDETGGLSPNELRARAKRFKAKHGCALVVIDYVQLMEVPGGSRNKSRENDISEVTRKLKALAKELKCPIIALSQLSRSLESRDNKRPILSDLRESGSIEQDADKVLFVHRPEYYERGEAGTEVESVDKGLAEIIVAKQRSGPTGRIDSRFIGKFCRFSVWDGLPRAQRIAAKRQQQEAEPANRVGPRRKKQAAQAVGETGQMLPPDPSPDDYR